MAQSQKLISIIVPCHNEQANIEPLYQALSQTINDLPESFEFIFVDDGSKDDTLIGLRELAERDERVRVIEMVRNFGKEIAITAGLHQSSGDAAICLDADLQHPPELIPDLIAKWHGGAEVVVGIRSPGSRHASFIKLAGSAVFYRLMNAISDVEIVARATDYRLIDRVVINEFNRFTEHSRITRGLIDWLGFKRAYVEFKTPSRNAGNAGYGIFKLVNLALNSFVSMSLVPLRFAGWLGAVIMLTSGATGLFIFIEKYLLKDPWGLGFSGPAILAVIILFLVGLMLVCLGLISLYIGVIHTEVMNRPLYVTRSRNRRGGRILVDAQEVVEHQKQEQEHEALRR